MYGRQAKPVALPGVEGLLEWVLGAVGPGIPPSTATRSAPPPKPYFATAATPQAHLVQALRSVLLLHGEELLSADGLSLDGLADDGPFVFDEYEIRLYLRLAPDGLRALREVDAEVRNTEDTVEDVEQYRGGGRARFTAFDLPTAVRPPDTTSTRPLTYEQFTAAARTEAGVLGGERLGGGSATTTERFNSRRAPMTYLQFERATWFIEVTRRSETGPFTQRRYAAYEVTVDHGGAYFLLDQRQLDGDRLRPLAAPDGSARGTGALPPVGEVTQQPSTEDSPAPDPSVRAPEVLPNGWWHLPRTGADAVGPGQKQRATVDRATADRATVDRATAAGMPELLGILPIVLRVDGEHALLYDRRLTAAQFADYLRAQPGWGGRDLMLFAAGAGTRARTAQGLAASSFARAVRDELGVGVLAPPGQLVVGQRDAQFGFKYYPRSGDGYVRLSRNLTNALRELGFLPVE
jgi:hypothetical protein